MRKLAGWPVLVAAVIGLGMPQEGLADDKETAGLRQELDYGYALLYELATSLQHADELLLVKAESDAVNAVTDDVAEAMTDTVEALEGMAESRGELDLEDMGLPRFARQIQKSIGEERVESLVPMAGKSGVDFERTLLLTHLGSLNQMRHLTEALAGAERIADHKRFLSDASERFDSLYERVDELLKTQYYCKP